MNKKFIIVLLTFLFSLNLHSQENIDFALPILNINPNARLGGIADIGVVSSVFYKDAGLFQNPAILSSNSIYTGSNIFLKNIKDNTANDAYFSGWSGYYATDSFNTVGFNFSYLNYENIFILKDSNELDSEYEPYEMFFQLTFAHSFNKTISAGLGIKYLRGNFAFASIENIINSYAVDFGCSYHKSYNLSDYSELNTSAGLAITNLGPRLENDENQKKFIPIKLLLGLFINPDIYVSRLFKLNIELYYQAEKYLIPSTPIYNTEGGIIDGKNPDISAFNALYQSFYDSPEGFSGEIDEIRHKFGSEFRLNYLNKSFIAIRHGRIFEMKTFGGENYQTYGCGLGFRGFMIDYSYIYSDNELLNKNWALTLGAKYNLDGDFFRF